MSAPDHDQSHREAGGLFPPTAWSRVAAAAAAGETETARAAMSEVCGRYWQPARKFLRWLGAGEEDAEDLVQEFFVKWATPENLARLDPDKGRLRSYLKQSLRRFFINAWRSAESLRRGGGVEITDLGNAGDVPAEPAAADALYDREWAAAVLAAVFARLRAAYAGRGRAAVFDSLRPGLPGGNGLQPLAAVAVSAGVSEPQIKLDLHRLRRRFGELLREEVASTLAQPEDLEDELRHLLHVMSHVSADAQ